MGKMDDDLKVFAQRLIAARMRKGWGPENLLTGFDLLQSHFALESGVGHRQRSAIYRTGECARCTARSIWAAADYPVTGPHVHFERSSGGFSLNS